jgi:predicted nucleotidyltransferase
MCSQSELSIITSEVVKAARRSLGDKLNKVILYGSYARGDYDDQSDIDIMILADIPHESCWNEYLRISDLTWELDLVHGVLVSIHVTDSETFNKYINVLPFYVNVMREGIELSA